MVFFTEGIFVLYSRKISMFPRPSPDPVRPTLIAASSSVHTLLEISESSLHGAAVLKKIFVSELVNTIYQIYHVPMKYAQ